MIKRNNGPGGKPRELYELDFDIVTPTASSSLLSGVVEAEAIKLICEALDALSPDIGNYWVKVSHVQLFESILSICEVEERHFAHIRHQLAKHSWAAISNQLVAEDYLTPASAKRLSLYFVDLSVCGKGLFVF